MTRAGRLAYAASALVAWGALALQFALLAAQFVQEGHSLAAALWRFLGFFTILTNLFVAVVATAAALAPAHRLASPRIRFAALVAALLVGLVYSLALRHIWSPEGWQAIADHALHDASPVAFLVAWLVGSHRRLAWRDAGGALLFPFAYFVYAMGRGAIDGWYAYYFLDPSQLGALQMGGSFVAILGATLFLALLLIAADRTLPPEMT